MRKQLIVIIGSLNVGGTERHLSIILPCLVDRGWSVQVLVLADKGALSSGLEKRGVLVNALLTSKEMNFLKKLPQIIKTPFRVFLSIIRITKKLREKPEAIVHFFLPEAFILGIVSSLIIHHQGPKVMSRRSLNNYYQRRPGVGFCESLLFNKTTMISGNSQAVVSQLESEGVSPDRIQLIYNGIDLASFSITKSRTEVRKELGISNEACVMIMVANLIPYKGHEDLLNALAKIKQQLPLDWHLLCVGRNDGLGDILKQKSVELGIFHQIHWLGSRNDVPDLLIASDIGILCSHEEGFSNAVLEGMAAGLPMVVTNVGGNAEAVLNEKSGIVVESRQPEALGQAILSMATNSEQASTMGALGKRRVAEVFSLETCINAYVEFYDKCLTMNEKGLKI